MESRPFARGAQPRTREGPAGDRPGPKGGYGDGRAHEGRSQYVRPACFQTTPALQGPAPCGRCLAAGLLEQSGTWWLGTPVLPTRITHPYTRPRTSTTPRS